MEKARPIKESEKLALGAIRATVIDTINKAKSGHPGMALDAAPTMLALYRDHLVADPKHPKWFNRDRLVFSSGHASALLYSMLHLTGYDLSLDDLKSFRQLDSKTPGHPEFGWTAGVDASGGPLGQGIAQAVGIAMAEAHLRASYPEGERLVSHYTYCLCGDGCLEEGISQEAISMAGHYRLNKLILFYDENGSTLDGPTSDSLSEDVKTRFLSASWDVLEADGEDIDAVSSCIEKAKKGTKPTVIIVHETIGFGSKNQGNCKTHGSPLGEEDGAHAKEVYGYPYPAFEIPEEAYAYFKRTFAARGEAAYEAYLKEEEAYKKDHPEEYKVFVAAKERDFSPFIKTWPSFPEDYAKAGRVTSGEVLKAIVPAAPFLMGGSADVAGSTNTNVSNIARFDADNYAGRDVRFGIREFAMAATCNGMLLHGGVAPYCACFFVFADYMKPALRMASLQELPAIYLFTHDSLAVGEDGPTHQPIEQLAMLRAQPNFNVVRPCDAKEVVAAYQIALSSKKTPTGIVLTRQGLPLLKETDAEKAKKGGYALLSPANPAIEIIATGSEVKLALDAAKLLQEKGLSAKVVSMPCVDLFEAQPKGYKDEVLSLPYDRRISIEIASTFGWARYAKTNIGIDTYGKSAPASVVLEDFGFTAEKVAERIAKEFLK